MTGIYSTLKNSLKYLVGNPFLLLPLICSLIIVTLLSFVSVRINHIIGNTNAIIITIWNTVIFPIIIFLVLAYLSAGLIFFALIL